MAFAVISDVHSNIEALTAVFADIDARGLDPVYCLGDVVGYGPDPMPCIDMIRKRCKITIRGNHDEALFTGADRFNPYARHAIEWTRSHIRPGLFRGKAVAARWKFLQELPLEYREGDYYFVHGSPRDPVNEYVYREDVFFNAEGKLRSIFKTVDRVLFIGHTHLPVVISDDLETFVPGEEGEDYQLKPDRKYIINVGSVGQPRDRDIRACYLEVDGDDLHYRRVPYEVETVVKKIGSNPALDSVLGSRLLVGM